MQTSPAFTPVNKDNFIAHVRELTAKGPRHVDNPDGVTAALAYLKKYLASEGYDVKVEPYGTKTHEVNLFCELAGTGTAAVLEVGAHWDTVKVSPGADDNASGVAGVLEIARVLRADLKAGHKPARTVRLCLFGGEEDSPNLCTGSRFHVENLKTAPDGVIVLEMIACRSKAAGSQRIPVALGMLDPELKRRTTGDFIAVIGIENAADYLKALSAAAATHTLPVASVSLPSAGGNYAGSDVSRSDHSPYWKKGWKGVMVTDTAEFRNHHYHQADDTSDKLDFDFATQVTATVADAVRALAG
jgi:aminopeptidase YwaD